MHQPTDTAITTQPGRCATCGTAIQQQVVLGIPFPRYCDNHLDDAVAASTVASNEVERERRKAKLRATIPPLYREIAKTKRDEYPTEAWASIQRWEPAEDGLARAWGLLVTGETGRFKSTMVCHHVSNIALRTGYSVAFLSVPEFETVQRLAWAEPKKSDGDAKFAAARQIKMARGARILIVDDLGKESATDQIERELHSLISRRLDQLLPTIVTLNASAAAYEARLSPERASAFMRRLTEYNRHIHVA